MLWHVSVILSVISLIQCKKFHDKIIDYDFQLLFHTTREIVPEYEIAPIMHNLNNLSNSDLRMKFNAFGKAIDIFLTPTDGPLAGIDTPVWRPFITKNRTINYKKLPGWILGNSIQFYRGLYDFSSMIVLDSNSSSPCFEGFIDGLTIRSLPAYLREIARSESDIQSSNSNETLIETDYHLIMKSNLSMSEDAIESAKEPIRLSDSLQDPDDLVEVRPLLNDTVFPSLMITTDYSYNNWTHRDYHYKVQIIDQLIFWNAVDARFKHVSDPKIRLRITGIIIGTIWFATPYTSDYMVSKEYDIVKACREMQLFWYESAPLLNLSTKAYNLIVTMTDKPSFEDVQGGKISISSAGSLSNTDELKSVMIINDRGAYNEVPLATEALSRLMGLGYISRNRSICDKSYNFTIIDPLKVSTIEPEWSICSLLKLPNFFNHSDYRRDMASGLKTTYERQCQLRRYDKACHDRAPDICQRLMCSYTNRWYKMLYGSCVASGPATEGTICSPGSICIDKKCTCVSKTC